MLFWLVARPMRRESALEMVLNAEMVPMEPPSRRKVGLRPKTFWMAISADKKALLRKEFCVFGDLCGGRRRYGWQLPEMGLSERETCFGQRSVRVLMRSC